MLGINNHRNIHWRPNFYPDSCSMLLDQSFAKACMEHETNIMEFVEAVWWYMGKTGAPPVGFINAHKGILPSGFHKNDNMSLLLDTATIAHSTSAVVYDARQAESIEERFWLINAFQAWSNSAVAVLNWK